MKKNLLIVCAGPTSLHKQWVYEKDRNFDTMVVHYGDDDSYLGDGEYYIRAKGTKFNIIGDIFDQIPKEYEYIFIPDDDLHIPIQDLNRLFEIANQYQLGICQPSLVGYYSVQINLHHPGSILRYTNYVEIIAPCFDRKSFDACRSSFNYNKSCWGIDVLWDMILGHPIDKIAVVDDVIAVHTRACFWGDNYSNNKISEPHEELKKLIDDNNLTYDKIVHSMVKKEENYSKSSESRLHPNAEFMKFSCKQLGRKFFI
jgi:hypothetical protein